MQLTKRLDALWHTDGSARVSFVDYLRAGFVVDVVLARNRIEPRAATPARLLGAEGHDVGHQHLQHT